MADRHLSILLTITAMNLLVGLANGLQMWALGMPDPLLWGTLAFLLNYVPILGPLTGVVVLFFVGLFSGGSLTPMLRELALTTCSTPITPRRSTRRLAAACASCGPQPSMRERPRRSRQLPLCDPPTRCFARAGSRRPSL